MPEKFRVATLSSPISALYYYTTPTEDLIEEALLALSAASTDTPTPTQEVGTLVLQLL